MLRWLIGQFAHSLARQKLAEAVGRATPSQSGSAPAAAIPQYGNCALVVVADCPAAIEGLLDRLKHVVLTEAADFTARSGKLAGQPVVVAVANCGEVATRVATALIDAHHPPLVTSIGLATAVGPSVKQGQLVIANRIVSPPGQPFVIDVQGPADGSRHFGTLLTVAELPATPAEQRQLAEKHNALAVDRIGWQVARACQREGTAMIAVQAIIADADQDVPAAIQHLVKQRSLAGKAGALVGSVVRQPSTVKELWRRKQSLWQSSDQLADFLTELISPPPH